MLVFSFVCQSDKAPTLGIQCDMRESATQEGYQHNIQIFKCIKAVQEK
jgi:hypothetical protein